MQEDMVARSAAASARATNPPLHISCGRLRALTELYPDIPAKYRQARGSPLRCAIQICPRSGSGLAGTRESDLIGGKRQAYSATGASTGGGGGGGSGGSGGGGRAVVVVAVVGGMMSAANKRRGQPAQWKTPQDKLNEMTAPIRQAFQNFKFGKGGVNLT